MSYDLKDINMRAQVDPQAFVNECDDIYQYKIEKAADMITESMHISPIVLLSGPSGSGKTTTALKIEEELRRRGIMSHSIAMDNYFKTLSFEESPKTPDGDYDYESPLCLDMELLIEHFDMLGRGKRIFVPKYEFSRQMRIMEPSKSLRVGKNEIVIFEGIHALNKRITDAYPAAFKLYISARSDILNNGKVFFKGSWMRLIRRLVRDDLFRGASVITTLGMWPNVRLGEKHNISPFKNTANLMFDSTLPYEVCVLKSYIKNLVKSIPDEIECFEPLEQILPALELFAGINSDYLSPESLLREFIGGSSYGL